MSFSAKVKEELIKYEKDYSERGILRDVFILGGSVNDPNKTYHLEIVMHSKEEAEKICGMMVSFDLHAKIIKRKKDYVVYMKERESIVDFLNIVGAHISLLEFENVRILKELRSNTNRIVNCDTANLEKTVGAAGKYIEAINKIIKKSGLGSLPENLVKTANLRIDHPDLSLEELGELHDPPVSKSCVYHRLKKIIEIGDIKKSTS